MLQQDKSSIELWVEVSLGYGHAELQINGSSFGFWPDATRSRRAVNSLVPEDASAVIFGGWAGRLDVLSFDDFIYRYWDTYRMKHKAYPDYPVFHIYLLPVGSAVLSQIDTYLRGLKGTEPEYNMLSTGSSRNCATLCLETLTAFNVLHNDIRLLGPRPSPKVLQTLMDEICQHTPAIEHKVKQLTPPSLVDFNTDQKKTKDGEEQ